MAVEVVDKKTFTGICLHPVKHIEQFLLGKMMTKKRRKNNIGFMMAQVCLFVICSNKLRVSGRQPVAGNADAIIVVINAGKLYGDLIFNAPVVNGQQVIATTTANFTYVDG